MTLRAFRSEWVKQRNPAFIAGALGAVAAFVAMSVSATFITADQPSGPGAGPAGAGLTVADLESASGIVAGFEQAATFMGIVALSVFAVSVAREFERGTIRLLLVTESRRLRLFGSKLVALSTFMALATAVALVVAIGASLVWASIDGLGTSEWFTADGASAIASAYVNVAIAAVAWGCSGAVLAIVTRSAAVTIGVGVGYFLIVESIVTAIWDATGDWLPGQTLAAFAQGGNETISYQVAASLLAAFVVASAGSTLMLFAQRDITD